MKHLSVFKPPSSVPRRGGSKLGGRRHHAAGEKWEAFKTWAETEANANAIADTFKTAFVPLLDELVEK
eukprot:2444373-Rhodomonas_salina.1